MPLHVSTFYTALVRAGQGLEKKTPLGCGERRVGALCEPDALETIPITITITITLTIEVDLQLMVFFYPRRAENRTFRPPVTQKQKNILNFKKGQK